MTEPLLVRLLGEVQAAHGATTIPVRGTQRLAVLALLALRAPRSVGRWEIIDALWGEDPPATAVNAVQVHVSALRKVLGRGSVVIAGDGYRLGGEVDVDVAEFVDGCRRGASELARGQAATAAETLRLALDLWRGPALAGLDAVPFVGAERSRLEEARVSVLEQRLEADLEVGRHRDVVAELESLVTVHPLREGLRGLLMQALYRCGRQAEALAVYDVGRRLLSDELGLDPSPALRAVHQGLLSQGEAVPSPSGVMSAARRELPALLDETIGRARELAALETLLSVGRGRLISVVGAGGVGKTRLAIALGHHVANTTYQAVVFVPLGHADKPADVPATICQALGVRTGEDAIATLEAALQGKRTLLICDTFEHVLDAAPLLPRLLAVAPDLRVLVTTRQPLRLRGEQLFPIHPLDAEGGRQQLSPAAELFVARVRDSDPTFEPTGAELVHIAEIVRRCGGLPLAVELAAARTRALTIAEVNRRLSDPLSLLTTGSRDRPERHRTLRASIAWSVSALTPEQAQFLARMTVFKGGFTLPAATATANVGPDEALAHVESLLDRSLIHRPPTVDGLHRFDLLDTISEYSAEMLDADELVQTKRRHAEYYRAWMRPLPEPTRTGATASTWQAQLLEQANMRQAVRWALAGPSGELAADLVIAAAWVWDQSGPQAELEDWLRQLLQRSDISAGRRCDAFWWQATLSTGGDPLLIEPPLAAARAIAERHNDTRRLVWVEILSLLGEILRERPHDALQAVRRGQALSAVHPETTNLHVSIFVLNGQLSAMGGATFGRVLRHRQQELATAGGSSAGLRALILLQLSEVMLRNDDPAQAIRYAEEGLQLGQQMESDEGLADSRSQRGCAQLLLGNEDAAIDDLRAALAGHLQLGATFMAGRDLVRLAAAAASVHPEEAATAVGVATASPATRGELTSWQQGGHQLDKLPARLLDLQDAAVASGRTLVAELGIELAMAAVLARFYRITEAT